MSWLKEFVEQPNAKLGGWPPCPYARQARLSNKIAVRFVTAQQLSTQVWAHVSLLSNNDVVVFCFDHQDIDYPTLYNVVTELNQQLMKQNIVVLEDHPDDAEFINGVQMNFGACGLLLMSNLDQLNLASDQLQNKGYYQYWSQENVDRVVTWRYQQ